MANNLRPLRELGGSTLWISSDAEKPIANLYRQPETPSVSLPAGALHLLALVQSQRCLPSAVRFDTGVARHPNDRMTQRHPAGAFWSADPSYARLQTFSWQDFQSVDMNKAYTMGRGAASGFTLIELLVVLVILGLLAGLVGPQVMKYVGTSKTKTARLQLEDLGAALDLYRLEVGRYPNNEEGLEALVRRPSGARNWNGPYLKKTQVPKDPWGYEFRYRFPGQHGAYDLYSLGMDNTEGGQGEAGDVVSWE